MSERPKKRARVGKTPWDIDEEAEPLVKLCEQDGCDLALIRVVASSLHVPMATTWPDDVYVGLCSYQRVSAGVSEMRKRIYSRFLFPKHNPTCVCCETYLKEFEECYKVTIGDLDQSWCWRKDCKSIGGWIYGEFVTDVLNAKSVERRLQIQNTVLPALHQVLLNIVLEYAVAESFRDLILSKPLHCHPYSNEDF